MAETLTYAELALRLSRSEDAAKSLAKRKRWRRTVGNDGLARVVIEDIDELLNLADPDRRGIGRPPANANRAKPAEPRSNPVHEFQAKLAVAEALSIERKEAFDREVERGAALSRELTEARMLAATVEPLRATIEALKAALAADKERIADIRQERDKWQEAASAPRGWFGWLKRA